MTDFDFFPRDNFTAYVIASRRKGKTTAVAKIVKSIGHRFDEIYLIYPGWNDPECPYLGIGLKSERVYTAFKKRLLEILWQRQIEIRKVIPNYKILIICDDCLGEEEFSKMPKNHILNEIAVNGRHKGISIIISVQFYAALSPILRTNAEYIIVFRLLGRNLEGIADSYNSGNKAKFKNLIKTCTEKKYNYLYIDLIDNKMYHYDLINYNRVYQ